MSEKTGKSRQGGTSQQQIEALITYLEQYPHVASGKFTTMNSREHLQGNWENLVIFLNSLGPKGKEKDVKLWKTTWRDLKSKVSDKIQKLKEEKATTGNNPININLNDIEKRILGIIGHEYVQGLASVPDSFPEEHNNAIQELIAGNEDILQEIPAPIIISELENIPIVVTNENESFINEEINYTGQNVIDIPCTSLQENRQTKTNERRKRRNAERLGVQLHDARESFELIADKHAEAMKMIADAIKLQAEAIDKMAKNEERQTQLLEIMLKYIQEKNK